MSPFGCVRALHSDVSHAIYFGLFWVTRGFLEVRPGVFRGSLKRRYVRPGRIFEMGVSRPRVRRVSQSKGKLADVETTVHLHSCSRLERCSTGEALLQRCTCRGATQQI